MKNMLYIMLTCSFSTIMNAQTYHEDNSLLRKAFVVYELDGNGFYHKKENVNLPYVNDIENNYAYNKKSHELYVQTKNSNVVITVAENYAKFLKKNSSIPQLNEKELPAAIQRVNLLLEEKFKILNEKRQKFINDSIAKAIADSIAKAREDSIRFANIKLQKDNYRNAHNWTWVPINRTRLSCTLCDKTISYEDSLFCIGYKNDSLYHVSWEKLPLGVTYPKVHRMYIPSSLKNDSKFKYHFDVYRDSLINNKSMLVEDTENFNSYNAYNALQKVASEAPYGYFNSWEWDNEYGSVSFNFRYTNTNKKTIKYIDVYWKITNDVKDVRKTGSFKGTGPLREWETGTWNWDSSSYYVAGDASKMSLTKVIITYMNGSQKILTSSMIKYE